MLSETDIHLITGFLYVLTRRTDISVSLGDRVADAASGTERDVDIVIASTDDCALMAVEVKDESRPLHVGLVEALCQKFTDMPSIGRRHIVSTSGYSEPAIRKACYHSVECLRLVRGPLPQFRGIDFSQLAGSHQSYLVWLSGPAVSLLPNAHLSHEDRAALTPDTPVTYPSGTEAAPRTIEALAHSVAAHATAAWAGPPHVHGPQEAIIDVEIADPPTLVLPSGPFLMTEARILGTVEWQTIFVPLEDSCFFEDPAGRPFAGACIFALRTGLLGMSIAEDTLEVRLFHIPNGLRKARPNRLHIFGPPRTGA